jgi:hypothetical protein
MKKRWGSSRISLALLVGLVSFCSAQLEHRGIVLDASTRHIAITGGLSAANLAAGERDPRMMMQLQRYQRRIEEQHSSFSGISEIADFFGVHDPTAGPQSSVTIQGTTTQIPATTVVDWSVSLGTGNVAPHMSPSTYSFNSDGTPDCIRDYAVFGLNVPGVTNGQANVIGINKLYSGTNPTGICLTKQPHVNWAYNGSTAGGSILGWVEPSLDGKKVAYVESAAGSSILHVLTWKAGQGTSATNAASPTPVRPVGGCTLTSSCLASLTYSTTSTTTRASVWTDWSTDKGYVASDDGNIYRISCIFHCTLNQNPTVDWVFALPVAGTGGALPVPTVTVVVHSKYLFVGDELGEVWSIDVSGATPVLVSLPVMVGGGGCQIANPPGRTGGSISNPCTANGGSYGVSDGILIDVVGSKIFAFSGNDGISNASAVVVQMNYDLSGQVRDSVGFGSAGNTTTNVDLHLGAFDNTFWGANPTQGHYFLCGTGKTTASSTQPWDYWIGFTNYPVMDSNPTQAPYVNLAVSGAPCTWLTELYNPNINVGGNPNDHDMLVGGVIDPNTGPLILDDISNGFIASPPVAIALFPGGVSEFVIDNISTEYQAASWYFSTLKATPSVAGCSTAPCAVKVHQSNLQ